MRTDDILGSTTSPMIQRDDPKAHPTQITYQTPQLTRRQLTIETDGQGRAVEGFDRAGEFDQGHHPVVDNLDQYIWDLFLKRKEKKLLLFASFTDTK